MAVIIAEPDTAEATTASQPVDTLSLDDLTDVSLRARRIRHRQVLITIIAAVLAVGALEWGPIGLGNGPLRMGTTGDRFGGVSSRQPVAIVTPLDNLGGSALVIDGVQLLGNVSYPAPHVLAMEALSNPECGDPFPVRTTAAGFVLADGSGGRPLGPLYGRAVGNATSTNIFAAFELSPPKPGACWLVAHIVTHYHVGIRHYAATDPYVLAACAGSRVRAERIADAAGW
jgi:hypothetical protein